MAILAQIVDGVVVHKFEINRPVTRVGRSTSNDVIIDDSAVSASHAHILLLPNEFFPTYQEAYIEDRGSTNGTFLNEQRVNGRQRLHHNDTLRIAWNQFKFLDDSEADMERTAHMLGK